MAHEKRFSVIETKKVTRYVVRVDRGDEIEFYEVEALSEEHAFALVESDCNAAEHICTYTPESNNG